MTRAIPKETDMSDICPKCGAEYAGPGHVCPPCNDPTTGLADEPDECGICHELISPHDAVYDGHCSRCRKDIKEMESACEIQPGLPDVSTTMGRNRIRRIFENTNLERHHLYRQLLKACDIIDQAEQIKDQQDEICRWRGRVTALSLKEDRVKMADLYEQIKIKDEVLREIEKWIRAFAVKPRGWTNALVCIEQAMKG